MDVEYRDIAEPLVVREVFGQLQPLLPDKYSPLHRGGAGNQGYLFALPSRAGRFLLELLGGGWAEPLEDGIRRAVPDSTERCALLRVR